MERFIRMKFVEGCLLNVSRNRSAAVSLRLLPKLIQSFQNFRNLDTHDICMFTERRHGMTRLFFDNLDLYTRERREGKAPPPFFNHVTQIQTRLQFLNIVFSGHVSPQDFRLTPEQVNTLWECLADDPTASDDLFQYLLMQIHSKDQHAIGLDGFRLIYEEKLGQLRPENISMLGLNLFSQLCQLQISKRLRAADASEGASTNAEVAAAAANSGKMEQLWKIALCAQNTDVSMKAIQILNTVYFGQGEEFLETCMRNLRAAAQELKSGKDEILLKIQRALLLLKTYLEVISHYLHSILFVSFHALYLPF